MCRFSQVGVNNKENCGMYLSSDVDAAAFKVLLVVFEKDIQTQQVCNIFESTFRTIQKEQKSKRARTKNSTNQKEHEPKKSTNQKQ